MNSASDEDYGLRARVEDVWGASPLRLARYAALFDQFPLDRMWRLLGVEHVLTWRRELFVPSTLLAEFPQTTDTTYLHRLTESNPRAWFVTVAHTVTDAQAVALLADHTFDLDQAALLPPGEPTAPLSPAAEGTSLPLTPLPPTPPETSTSSSSDVPGSKDARLPGVEPSVTASAPGRLHLAVDNPEPGLLVVSENWLPGWQVENPQCGRPPGACSADTAPILGLPAFVPVRADLTLVAVPVPAGVVQFDLVYQPTSVRLGLWISGLTLLLLLGVALLAAVKTMRRVVSPVPNP